MYQIKLILPFLMMTFSNTIYAGNGNPIELGEVNWQRNFEEGIAQSKAQQKPIFLLFQEVPGCSTCQNYGQNVLSHPLIVEAIESLFIPVAIFNNKGGKDAEVLKYYGEPSWNNPVVRIVDKNRKNLINRVNGNYTQLGIIQAMRLALQAEEREIPVYLSLLEQEMIAEKTGTESATFSMYCFWTGEKEIGKLKGVLETQAGFMNGREVVQVKYDPEIMNYKKLLESANAASCASQVFTEDKNQIRVTEAVMGKGKANDKGKFRKDREPKYYLGKTIYRFIPMTQLQAVKVNSLIGQQQSPEKLLSPRQLDLLKEVQKNPNAKWKNVINQDFVKAWKEVIAIRRA